MVFLSLVYCILVATIRLGDLHDQVCMESWKHYSEAYVLFRELLKQAVIDYE